MKFLIKRLDRPDERRTFDRGVFETVQLPGIVVGKARYQPGWKWSRDVGAASGQTSCQVEHVCMVLSGRAAIKMDDGSEYRVQPGDLFYCPPGHDSWVVGEEPYVSLHFQGAETYTS